MTELDVKRDGAVARLILNGPEMRNALSPAVLRAVVDACAELATDDEVRVVVLRGAAGTFSAGANLPTFMAELGGKAEETCDLGRRAAEALAALPQITVAAIEGHCVGGGVVLAAACDVRECTASAMFCIPELEIGIPLAWGATERLVQLLGETAAIDLILTSRRFDASEAARLGLVTRVVEGPMDEALAALVDVIAVRPAGTLRTTKRQLMAIRTGRFDASADAAALVSALADPETQQAAQRYMARRLAKKRR
ncbi:MAG: enoyl-CoA hydratase/isomerase family protein [Deltaproteobacteria bacterium]|nr:enoyl-CoA hydratase/isomerase family protein [Deltaproteobacteria bacterium]